MAERMVDAGAPPSRITLAPNAVQAADFEWAPRDQSLAGELGIPIEARVIGYISSLVEYEGIDTLIEAFAAVCKATSQPVHLVLVGEGSEGERLRLLARSRGLVNVSFTGQVPHHEVHRYYSLIDLFVVPRTPQQVCQLVTPLKPFEAFASGRTVVFSDVRALREIAEDSGAAALFEAGNADSLADLLLMLLQDPERCHELALRGYDWVRSARSWQANVAAYQQVYASLGAH
jgi:glycosyltransferase involved in cell wall biosynthesis